MIHDRILKQLMLAMSLLAISSHASATAQSPSEPLPVTAIWHIQQVPLSFRSEHTYYACSSLKKKITAILGAVGAREDLVVDLPCRSDGVTNNAFAVITVATPVAATLENVTAATTYSPQTQLAARLNKVQLPSANDVERFTAEWRPLTLRRQRALRIDARDCDLLRNLVAQVFPPMGVRLDQPRFICPATSATRSLPKLQVIALIATPGVEPVAYSVAEPKTP